MKRKIKELMASDVGCITQLCMADTNKLCRYTYWACMNFGNASPFNASQLTTQIHVEMQTNVFKKGCIALVMPTLPTSYMSADISVASGNALVICGQELGTGELVATGGQGRAVTAFCKRN